MTIGLITYHAAYNYGSLLQAYATQEAIESLGHSCEIINYRFYGQKAFYKRIRTKYGLKTMVLDAIQFSVLKGKKLREDKMEQFISDCLHITDEISTPDALNEYSDTYDVYLSGSDQIWSKYSSELYYENWKWMHPYLLTFTNKKKISYGSSIGSMKNSDLDYIKKYILRYEHIAMRETSVARRLGTYLDRKLDTVLDPTLLLSGEEYREEFNIPFHTSDNYILYYTLRGFKEVFRQRKILLELSKQVGVPIYSITPFCSFPSNKHYINKISSGVEDFLSLIQGATMVITDSFHGTVFSILFEKKFYSICKGWDTDYRKLDLLSELGIKHRCVSVLSDCNINAGIDYSEVGERLSALREYSLSYLRNAIEK